MNNNNKESPNLFFRIINTLFSLLMPPKIEHETYIPITTLVDFIEQLKVGDNNNENIKEMNVDNNIIENINIEELKVVDNIIENIENINIEELKVVDNIIENENIENENIENENIEELKVVDNIIENENIEELNVVDNIIENENIENENIEELKVVDNIIENENIEELNVVDNIIDDIIENIEQLNDEYIDNSTEELSQSFFAYDIEQLASVLFVNNMNSENKYNYYCLEDTPISYSENNYIGQPENIDNTDKIIPVNLD